MRCAVNGSSLRRKNRTMANNRKYPRIVENADGWSDWIIPQMSDYRMACCDCGLVHRVQFRVHMVTKRNRDGSFHKTIVRGRQFGVEMRAGRDNRATANMRRKKGG